MKKLLVLFLLLINFYFPAAAGNIKFIQVTDVHLTKENAQYLKDFVDNINSSYTDLDFVIFTGDNIDKPKFDDLETFLSIVKNIKVKKYVLLGNHDVSKNQKLDKQLYMKTVRKELGLYHSKTPNYVFVKDNVVFVVMDGVKEVIPGPGGYFKQSELDWLDKTLSKYGKNKVVIIQHFPLLTTKSVNHSIYKEEEYLKVLDKHSNVIAVISGHYHQNREEMKGNVYNIVTKNFCNNQYYKLIEIDSDTGMVYTMLNDNKFNENEI